MFRIFNFLDNIMDHVVQTNSYDWNAEIPGMAVYGKRYFGNQYSDRKMQKLKSRIVKFWGYG